MEANEKVFKMTKGKQKLRYDMRKDGKLDISFVRFDKKYKGNYGMNYPDAFLTKNGFNDPNKTYFSWVDVSHRDGGHQARTMRAATSPRLATKRRLNMPLVYPILW